MGQTFRALTPRHWSARHGLSTPLERPPAASRPAKLALLGLFVIVLGALGPTNTWDLPVYLLLAAGAFWLAAWRGRRRFSLPRGLALAVVTGGLAILAYLPFYQHYKVELGDKSGSLVSRFLTFTHNGSPLWPWLNIWALFLFLAFSFTLWAFFRKRSPSPPHPLTPSPRPSPGRRVIAMLALAGLALLLFMVDRPAAALVVVPLGLALALLPRRRAPVRETFALLLFGLGLGITGGIELLNLRDFLEGGDWYRMNTVFKFGIPAWLALGLAGSYAVPRLWLALDRAPKGRAGWLSLAWRTVAVLLLAASLFFLPLGVRARVDDRFPGPRPPTGTLDGAAYMTVGRYTWPDDRHTIVLSYDYEAIHWMLDNAVAAGPGVAPVVAEAPAGDYQVNGAPVAYDYYRAGGLRVASLTGFPTFVGQHQFEQRAAGDVYGRTAAGQQFFQTTDPAAAMRTIRDLGVQYIYIGQLERLLFTPQSLAKFDSLVTAGQLQVAYRNPQVIIYRVVG